MITVLTKSEQKSVLSTLFSFYEIKDLTNKIVRLPREKPNKMRSSVLIIHAVRFQIEILLQRIDCDSRKKNLSQIIDDVWHRSRCFSQSER
jgi:hypothetical protein